MQRMLARLVRDDEGQDLIEYGLLAALISLIVIIAITSVGESLNTTYESLADRIPPASMSSLLRTFIVDDRGQDLIEYALLSAFIGLCAVVAWSSIPPGIATAYLSWDTSVQNLSSCTPDPGGGGC
jgi:pilus assembly protein Flp/PilA